MDGLNPKATAFLRRAYKHVGVDLDAWPARIPSADSVAAWRKACDAKLHAFVRLCRKLHPRPNTPKGFAHLAHPPVVTRDGSKYGLRGVYPTGADRGLLAFTADKQQFQQAAE